MADKRESGGDWAKATAKSPDDFPGENVTAAEQSAGTRENRSVSELEEAPPDRADAASHRSGADQEAYIPGPIPDPPDPAHAGQAQPVENRKSPTEGVVGRRSGVTSRDNPPTAGGITDFSKSSRKQR